MKRISTIVIGAGQAGLAMSRSLSERAIDHVVLERGEVGDSWRRMRWDSLRLLTPNWQSRLPGDPYAGPDRHGFMTMPEVVARLDRYARSIDAPVLPGTAVLAAQPDGVGYRVSTSQGGFACRTLVIATGACAVPSVPPDAAHLPADIVQKTPASYKRPDDLPPGGVVVVGASATGVQLAREIQASGRPVILSVGAHVRAPRIYRGLDIHWWMDAAGLFDLRHDEVDDIERVRRAPSMQLVGSPSRETLDLNALTADGVEIVGRFAGVRDSRLLFSGSLANACASADLKLDRLLARLDEWAAENDLGGLVDPPHRLAPTRAPASPRLEIDLGRGEIRSVLWATGYRPNLAWLKAPVFDRKGRLRHDGGVVAAPGLYAMGLPFMRRRKSTLIDGVGDDARELVEHMVNQPGRLAA